MRRKAMPPLNLEFLHLGGNTERALSRSVDYVEFDVQMESHFSAYR